MKTFTLAFILLTNISFGFEQINGGTIASQANKLIGLPYVWGGENLNKGVDCSAFVKLIYSRYGYSVPRTALTQAKNTNECPTITELNQATIGDAVYFRNDEGHIHHVAIITGFDGSRPIITHAKGKKYGVVRERMSDRYVSEFIGAKRFYSCTSPLAETPTSEEIAENILYYSRKYNIDTSILYTIASIESDFEPLVITIETSPEIGELLKDLRKVGLKIVTGGTTFHSKKAIVNIYPKDIPAAQFLAEALKKADYTFDLGLMQIHSSNFSLKEAAGLIYPQKNIEKASQILTSCKKQFALKKHQIECYNRGGRNLQRALSKGLSHYPYYTRYKEHYRNYFVAKGE